MRNQFKTKVSVLLALFFGLMVSGSAQREDGVITPEEESRMLQQTTAPEMGVSWNINDGASMEKAKELLNASPVQTQAVLVEPKDYMLESGDMITKAEWDFYNNASPEDKAKMLENSDLIKTMMPKK